MRTIRFRGMPFASIDFDFINVHIDKNEFVYGNLIVDDKDTYIVNGVVSCDEDNIQLERWIPVRPETVGQFTGLLDKNGKEIWEGDRLHYNTGFSGEPKSRDGVVVWKQGAFGVDNASMQLTWYTDHYGCENIGNIHEIKKGE
jgi:hypothetical protein